MFYDERILLERGKIVRQAAVLAMAIAALFLLGRLGIYLCAGAAFSFKHCFAEACVIAAAALILLFGELRYRIAKDERLAAAKNGYYSRMGKVLLFAVLFGFSLSLITASERIQPDIPANSILFSLEIAGILYLYYQFKKRDICFNYTFIEQSKPAYYKKALLNAGVMCLIAAALYAFSAVISFLVYNSAYNLSVILFAGLFSALGVGLGYLFLSFLEKSDYDQTDGTVGRSVVILAVLTVLLVAAKEAVSLYYYHIVYNVGIGEDAIQSKIAAILHTRNFLNYQAAVCFGLTISYLLTRWRGRRMLNAAAKWAMILVGVNELIGFLFGTVNNMLSLRDKGLAMQWAESARTLIFILISLAIVALFVAALIKDTGRRLWLIALPIALAAVQLICYLLFVQARFSALFLQSAAAILASVILLTQLCRAAPPAQEPGAPAPAEGGERFP